jgi:hypothetical protein
LLVAGSCGGEKIPLCCDRDDVAGLLDVADWTQLAVHFDAACHLWCSQQLGGLKLLRLHAVFVPVGMNNLSHRVACITCQFVCA